MNPYDWQRHRPRVQVPRSEVGRLAKKLVRGRSAVLLAGRGLGKSVFLRQVQAALERHNGDELRVVLLTAPPSPLTTERCLAALALALGVDPAGVLSAHQLIELYLAAPQSAGRLVLLYDELDRYGRPEAGRPVARPVESSPGREFFNDLELMRRDRPEVGILAVGSLGVFTLRDAMASSFLARAEAIRIQPFGEEELRLLARPFSERGQPLSSETASALLLTSGGNPALLTYGLESLWDVDKPTANDVARSFARFKDRFGEFLRDFQLSFGDPELSLAPRRVWKLIRRSTEPLPHADLKKACGTAGNPLRLSFADVLDLLQAAGLVRIKGSPRANPVDVRPIAGLLTLSDQAPIADSFVEHLRHDLTDVLGRIHSAAADFFRPGAKGKRLVPEAVFSAFVGLGLEMLGWQVEREAQRARGRTDLQLRWNGGSEVAVVEIKIWGRPKHREIQQQIEGYWTAGVAAGAAVMLTDAELPDWPERYRRECLDDQETEWYEANASPVRGRHTVRSRTPDGLDAAVDHFLLRVPR